MTPSEDEQSKSALHQSHPKMAQRINSLTKANQRMPESDRSAQYSQPRSTYTANPTITAPSRKTSRLKTIERNILALFKMGRIERFAKDAIAHCVLLASQMDALRKDIIDQNEKIYEHNDHIGEKLTEVLSKTSAQNELSSAYHAEAARAFSDLSRRIDILGLQGPQNSRESAVRQIDESDHEASSDGFKAFLDFFYHKLENRYRGSRAEIKNRLRVYLPETTVAVRETGGLKVLDLGCGRGEWLELLRDEGLAARGIDLNTLQIEEAAGLGLDVSKADAIRVLKSADDNSISVITAHHVIEHLPFEQTAWIVRESIRVLAPGGILIIETPNVRNLLVGANTFHDDPTHLKPITDSVLKVLYETAGYHPIEARPLHPHLKLSEFLAKDKFDPELAYLLFGAQDIAIIGYKPKEK